MATDNQKFVAAASRLLDEAIADTFRERLDAHRTLNGFTEEILTRHLQNASNDLDDNLRKLRSPLYHRPTVALMYLLRYQFSHVNLAWSMLSASPMRQHAAMANRAERLQIIDFGAGNFAGLLGLALFNSELIADGIQPPKSSVVSFEPAKAMRCTGASTWIKFQEKAVDKSRDDYAVLGPLRNALKLIDHEVDSLATSPKNDSDPDAHRCLIAMHVFYKNSRHQQDIVQRMNTLHEFFQPHIGFVSCHTGLVAKAKELLPQSRDTLPLKFHPKIASSTALSQIPSAVREFGSSSSGSLVRPSNYSPVWNRDTSVLYWPNDL